LFGSVPARLVSGEDAFAEKHVVLVSWHQLVFRLEVIVVFESSVDVAFCKVAVSSVRVHQRSELRIQLLVVYQRIQVLDAFLELLLDHRDGSFQELPGLVQVADRLRNVV